jgi:hypothetical protein
MKLLCARVRDLLLEESNVQPVQSPVTVCGDIHGQFWDVLEILRQGGMVPGTSYIFMASHTFSRLTLTVIRETLLIEGTTVSRHFHCCWPSKPGKSVETKHSGTHIKGILTG